MCFIYSYLPPNRLELKTGLAQSLTSFTIQVFAKAGLFAYITRVAVVGRTPIITCFCGYVTFAAELPSLEAGWKPFCLRHVIIFGGKTTADECDRRKFRKYHDLCQNKSFDRSSTSENSVLDTIKNRPIFFDRSPPLSLIERPPLIRVGLHISG